MRTPAIAFVCSALSGLLCVVVPVLVLQDQSDPTPIWPLSGVFEQIRFLPTSIGLLIVGMVCGYVQPRYWHILGVLTVVLLPLTAIVEMTLGVDHNLWPFEFIFYGAYALPGLIGAAITGVYLRPTLHPEHETQATE